MADSLDFGTTSSCSHSPENWGQRGAARQLQSQHLPQGQRCSLETWPHLRTCKFYGINWGINTQERPPGNDLAPNKRMFI